MAETTDSSNGKNKLLVVAPEGQIYQSMIEQFSKYGISIERFHPTKEGINEVINNYKGVIFDMGDTDSKKLSDEVIYNDGFVSTPPLLAYYHWGVDSDRNINFKSHFPVYDAMEPFSKDSLTEIVNLLSKEN